MVGLENIREKHYVYFSDNDELLAFGQTKSDGKMLFVGKKYVYVIDDKHSDEVKQLLNNPLNKYYVLFDQSRSFDKGRGFNKINIISKNDKNSTCFDIIVIKDDFSENEKSLLAKMQFSEKGFHIVNTIPITYDDRERESFHQSKNVCLTNIQIYQNNSNVPQEYVFKNRIEINLLRTERETGINDKAYNVLLPFAVVSDIVLFPISSVLGCRNAYHGCMPE
ncbi:MAG: hypothetical protein IJ187_06135 [Neisseriaceae bacterium]|nr:hypothetical protein [Neisseriaceae bacterium]